MMPKSHLIYGFLFSLLIFLLSPSIKLSGFLIVFLSSIFIDLDHAVRYSIKTKNFNPLAFWKWSILEGNARKNLNYSVYKLPVFFLHGVEFVLVLAILSFYFNWALFVLIGVLFHLFLDYIDLLQKHEPLIMKISQIAVLIRNKNKEEFNFKWQKMKNE